MREVLLFAVHCNSFVMPSRTFSGDEDLLISLLEPLFFQLVFIYRMMGLSRPLTIQITTDATCQHIVVFFGFTIRFG